MSRYTLASGGPRSGRGSSGSRRGPRPSRSGRSRGRATDGRATDHGLAAGLGADRRSDAARSAGASPTACRPGAAGGAAGPRRARSTGALPMRSRRHSICLVFRAAGAAPPRQRRADTSADRDAQGLVEPAQRRPAMPAAMRRLHEPPLGPGQLGDSAGRSRVAERGRASRRTAPGARSARRASYQSALAPAAGRRSGAARTGRRATALCRIFDRYLQLTRYTWSTRRSAGTTSSPGCAVRPSTRPGRDPAAQAVLGGEGRPARWRRRRGTHGSSCRSVVQAVEPLPRRAVDPEQFLRPGPQRHRDPGEAHHAEPGDRLGHRRPVVTHGAHPPPTPIRRVRSVLRASPRS